MFKDDKYSSRAACQERKTGRRLLAKAEKLGRLAGRSQSSGRDFSKTASKDKRSKRYLAPSYHVASPELQR